MPSRSVKQGAVLDQHPPGERVPTTREAGTHPLQATRNRAPGRTRARPAPRHGKVEASCLSRRHARPHRLAQPQHCPPRAKALGVRPSADLPVPAKRPPPVGKKTMRRRLPTPTRGGPALLARRLSTSSPPTRCPRLRGRGHEQAPLYWWPGPDPLSAVILSQSGAGRAAQVISSSRQTRASDAAHPAGCTTRRLVSSIVSSRERHGSMEADY